MIYLTKIFNNPTSTQQNCTFLKSVFTVNLFLKFMEDQTFTRPLMCDRPSAGV